MIKYIITILLGLIVGAGWFGAYLSLDNNTLESSDVLGASDGAITRINQWISSSTRDALVTRIVDSDVWMGNATITVAQICLTGDTCETTWPTGGGGGGGVGLGTTSPWTNGNLAYVTGLGTVGSVATGTLTTTATGTQLSATRGLVGGSAIFSWSTGYDAVRVASTTNWQTAFGWGNHANAGYLSTTSGNWAGTFDGLEGTAYLSRSNHTGTQSSTTITGLGTLAGLSGVDISANTNLAGDSEIVLTGDTLSIDASIARDSELHSAVTLSGALDYITLVGQNIVRGAIDLATDVTGLLSLALGGTGSSLSDPGTDRIMFWDDSAGSTTWLTAGAGLSISGTTLSATGGGTGTSTKTYSYIVSANGGDYTTIQSAIDACSTAGGGSIFLADSTYSQGATGLRWKGSGCHIHGKGSGTTTITFTGATTLFKTNSAGGLYSNNGVHNVRITADGNTSGIAFDMSDMSNQHYSNIIADNIGTFIRINDTQNITFYNTFEKFYATTITAFGLNASSTNPTNGNRFIDGFLGYGANVIGAQFNNSNGTLFQSIRLEPSSAVGTVGLKIFDAPAPNDGVFGNRFEDLYIEGNSVGIQILATAGSGGGIKRNMFNGMVEANNTDLSLGTNIARDNTFYNITDSLFGNAVTSFQQFFGIGTTTPSKELTVVGGGQFTSLVNCDTIDTDVNGILTCGTDATGGGGGVGALSTTTDIIGAPGTPESVSYVSEDFLIGGGSSTTAEFLFDPDAGQLFIASTSNSNATATIESSNNAQAVRLGDDSNVGIEWVFSTVGDVIARAYGSITELVFAFAETLFQGNVRVTGDLHVATTTYYGATSSDALVIDGYTNSGEWIQEFCTTPTGETTQVIADTLRGCNRYTYIEDANGAIDFVVPTTGTSTYFNLRPGATGVTTVAGDGMAIGWASGIDFGDLQRHQPAVEFPIRRSSMANASSTFIVAGITDKIGVSADLATEPGQGFYVFATSSANYLFACNPPTGSTVYTNTGIATSTSAVDLANPFVHFRIEVSGTSNTAVTAILKARTVSNQNFTQVASCTQDNSASTQAVAPTVGIGKSTAGSASALHVMFLKFWYKQPVF